jgi:uncharacterized protein (DUF1778 family)
MEDREREQLNLTIDLEAKTLLGKLAQIEKRSMANYLETLIYRAAHSLGVTVDSEIAGNGRVVNPKRKSGKR